MIDKFRKKRSLKETTNNQFTVGYESVSVQCLHKHITLVLVDTNYVVISRWTIELRPKFAEWIDYDRKCRVHKLLKLQIPIISFLYGQHWKVFMSERILYVLDKM